MNKHKTRMLILASPNGTLTMRTAKEHRERTTAYTRHWQVLFQFRAFIAGQETLIKYRNAAYGYVIHTYGG